MHIITDYLDSSQSKFFAKDVRNLLEPVVVKDVRVLGAVAALVNNQGAGVEAVEGGALGAGQGRVSDGCVAPGVRKVAWIFHRIGGRQISEHAVQIPHGIP